MAHYRRRLHPRGAVCGKARCRCRSCCCCCCRFNRLRCWYILLLLLLPLLPLLLPLLLQAASGGQRSDRACDGRGVVRVFDVQSVRGAPSGGGSCAAGGTGSIGRASGCAMDVAGECVRGTSTHGGVEGRVEVGQLVVFCTGWGRGQGRAEGLALHQELCARPARQGAAGGCGTLCRYPPHSIPRRRRR